MSTNLNDAFGGETEEEKKIMKTTKYQRRKNVRKRKFREPIFENF